MPFRFRRSIKIAPGIEMNIGKQGINSFTIGKTTFGKRGVFHNFGIPGSGLSYRAQIAGGSVLDVFAPLETEEDTPAHTDVVMALNDRGEIVLKDKNGQPLPGKKVAAEKKQNREAILNWLEEQQVKWNAGIDSLLNIHLTTPAPDGDVVVNPDADKSDDGYKKAEQALRTDPEVMSAALSSAFSTITWPRETTISFDVDPDGKTVYLDVDLPEVEDMPSQAARVDANTLRLEVEDRPKNQVQQDYLKHIHGIGFRLIGEVFAHLPAVTTVVFSGYSQRLNPRTGNTDSQYLYSVRVPREKWQKINFANLAKIDVVDCFEEFDLRRKATKQGAITAIKPFEK